MKKILLLGGSAQQIVAIKTAKKLGYYTVLCDYLPDNPGQHYADKFYLVSTTDKEAVLKVAEDEKIDGILAYATDPAAPTAAYVAEKLDLPTNPFTAVNTLCNKDIFRKYLSENGFVVPLSKGYSRINEAIKDCDRFDFPIIVKPVDSSGSKGVTVLKSKENIREALKFAFSYSKAKRVIIEEYIEKDHRYIIGGDIFVIDSKVCLWGLLNCLRDDEVNTLVPVGKSYPLELSSSQTELIKDSLQKLVSSIGIRFGAMNVELMLDKNGKCYIVDAGPRAGGNMIPDLLNMIFDVDLVEMSVQTAMGVQIEPKEINEKPCFYVSYNLHSKENGVLKAIEFDDEIEKHIVKKCLYVSIGDKVSYFDDASKALGIVFMKFDSLEQQKIIENINEHIKVIVK